MASRSSALRKSPAKPKSAPKAKASVKKTSGASGKAGKLPEWNLTDLYPAIDAPEVARDLDKLDADCVAFETAYKGKIAEQVAQPEGGEWLAGAIKSYEAISDLSGRLSSYAVVMHADNEAKPEISKFYGDVLERLTAASVHLLFFDLELNRVDDGVIERAMAVPSLNHYRPWIEDLRKDKPYQLEDRVERALLRQNAQPGPAESARDEASGYLIVYPS